MVGDYALSFALALGGSVPVTWGVRTLARRFNLVAKPRADRWHRKPTALYGGVGIFIGFLVSYLLRRPATLAGDALLVGCSAGMFALGLIDDYVTLKPYAKLVGQIVFSSILTMGGLRLHWLPVPVLDQALTLFWLVGITNAVNLLDNLDGLAGGIATICALFLVYFCHQTGQHDSAILASTFAGAVTGFLIFNFNPASIFMGDCGSLFLGFFLGGLTMVSSSGGVRGNVIAVLAVPVLLLLIPILDTTLVTFTRKFHGRPISQGGRDHTSHRLVALGLSERSAALALWGLAAASGGIAIFVRSLDGPVGLILLPAFAMAILFFLVFLGRVKVYQPVDNEAEGQGRALLPTLAEFGHKRRIFEVCNDLLIVVLAYWGSFLLRFDGLLPSPFYESFIQALPVVVGAQLVAFLALGLYRGLWRYTSIGDMGVQVRAVAGAWIASCVAIAATFGLGGFSRGALVMNGFLLLVGIPGSRVSFRAIRILVLRLQSPPSGRRVLIYGAGDGGELLVRELFQNRELGLIPVAFIDDDQQKQGRVVHGLKVLSSLEDARSLMGEGNIDELLISTAKLSPARIDELNQWSIREGVRTRRMRISLDEIAAN